MAKKLTEYGYAMVAILKNGEEWIVHSTIRSRRKDVIKHATSTFFGGGKEWSYIKRQGWRIQKIKITSVRS